MVPGFCLLPLGFTDLDLDAMSQDREETPLIGERGKLSLSHGNISFFLTFVCVFAHNQHPLLAYPDTNESQAARIYSPVCVVEPAIIETLV